MEASPFGPVLGVYADELPPAFREQFFLPISARYRVVLEGTMDRVWHRPRWLWPLFWLSAQFDMLFPETGRDIPASMTISGFQDDHGPPYQTWQRTFRFPRRRQFNAKMCFDPRRERVVELVGPAGSLELAWSVRFDPPATMEIATVACAIRLGRWRLGLPKLLFETVRAVQRAGELGQDSIHIDLTVTHPLLGEVFGYEGTFRLRRKPTEAASTQQ